MYDKDRGSQKSMRPASEERSVERLLCVPLNNRMYLIYFEEIACTNLPEILRT